MAETKEEKKARLLRIMGGPSRVNPDVDKAMKGEKGKRPKKKKKKRLVVPALTDAEKMDRGMPLSPKSSIRQKRK